MIRNSSTRLSDITERDAPAVLQFWGTGAQRRSLFYWRRLRGYADSIAAIAAARARSELMVGIIQRSA